MRGIMIIQSTRVWQDGKFIPLALEIEEERIVRVCSFGEQTPDMDFGDRRILPGFLDIHTHGAYGYDTNDAETEGLKDWMRRIPEEGVTGILPTMVTQGEQVLLKAAASVAQVVEEGYEGAEILGIHLEGPYLDMDYKGAQPPEAIVEPSIEQFEKFQRAAGGLIKYVTMAPEHDENYALLRYLDKRGVVVSMGHSSAAYEEGLAAVQAGAKSMTHVYNGMSPFHHRKPGLVGLALTEPSLYGEIIGDGQHSHLTSLSLFYRCKDLKHAILVTDSLRVKHCPKDGYYELGGHQIVLDEQGLARLAGTDTIAGSTLAMNQGLRILIEKAGVSEEAAINSCTVNPAECLGVDDRKGRLKEGYDADIVVLEDDYRVSSVFCRGKLYMYGMKKM